MRKLSAKWIPKYLNADQNSQRCLSSEQYLEFFGEVQMIYCRDWWPWTKPGYVTMTCKESNNERNGGIAAYPALPKKSSEWKNPLEKFSPEIFGIKKTSASLIIFQRAKLSTPSITHVCWWNWRTFDEKTPWEIHQALLVLARQCSCSLGSCNPQETGLP